jgi:3-oxoadipate enol-lactonase
MSISASNGPKIVYDVHGEGPPLVMVHPLPFDRNVWLYQQARFSNCFRTIAMDLRGWGQSGKPIEPFALEDMGADVLAVLAQEGVAGDAIIMGCSIGSKISLMLACDRPEIFSAAILVGGNSGRQDQFGRRIDGYRQHAGSGTLPDYHLGHLRYGVTSSWADSPIGRYLLQGFVERARDLDAESIAQVFRAIGDSDLTERLSSHAKPVLIVNGEFDNALPGGTRTASLLPNVEHHILPGAGHCCFLEKPAEFDDLVMAFLQARGLWPS